MELAHAQPALFDIEHARGKKLQTGKITFEVRGHASTGLYAGKNDCQSHVFVDTWMLTVKPVYKLLNVSDVLKWTTNTHVTQFSLTFKA